MSQWTYSNEPKYDFIKLPDGTIINAACVQKVSHETRDWEGPPGMNGKTTIVLEHTTHFVNERLSDGKIYAWFAERAVDIGGES